MCSRSGWPRRTSTDRLNGVSTIFTQTALCLRAGVVFCSFLAGFGRRTEGALRGAGRHARGPLRCAEVPCDHDSEARNVLPRQSSRLIESVVKSQAGRRDRPVPASLESTQKKRAIRSQSGHPKFFSRFDSTAALQPDETFVSSPQIVSSKRFIGASPQRPTPFRARGRDPRRLRECPAPSAAGCARTCACIRA